MHYSSIPRQSGFTLIELSIVLVIIGLIIGSILTGRDLMRAAELRNIIAEINEYKNSLLTFKMKYGQLPGDLQKASTYWPSCTDSGANTCDGDGDGIIFDNNYEDMRAWQHLSLAGMAPGNFTGIGNGAIDTRAAGINTPATDMNGGCITIDHRTGAIYGRSGRTAFEVGSSSNGGGTWEDCEGGLLSSIEAYDLDVKIDDSRADSGKFFGQNARGVSKVDANACVDGDPADASADYLLENTDITCQVRFWFD